MTTSPTPGRSSGRHHMQALPADRLIEGRIAIAQDVARLRAALRSVDENIVSVGLKRPHALMDLTLRTFVLLKYLDAAPALWGANATGVRPEWLRLREQVATAFDRYLQLFDAERRSKRYVKPSTRRAQWFE